MCLKHPVLIREELIKQFDYELEEKISHCNNLEHNSTLIWVGSCLLSAYRSDTFLLYSGLARFLRVAKASRNTLTAPPFSSAACHCHINGSFSEICDSRTGQCECKANVIGRRCDVCKVSDKKQCFLSGFFPVCHN